MIQGTVRYSAPELLQGLKPRYSTDIYSLAIIMWQLKENEIPYESIRSNDIIIWQVVKNNLRPDSTFLLLTELNTENCFDEKLQRNISHQYCKSDLMFHEMIKNIAKPLTPTTFKVKGGIKNLSRTDFRKKRDMLFTKHDCGISQACSKKVDIRKNLFDCKSLDLSERIEDDEYEDDLENNYHSNILVDKKLHLRSCKKLFQIDNEYVKLYKLCWHQKESLRPNIVNIFNLIQKFLNRLNV